MRCAPLLAAVLVGVNGDQVLVARELVLAAAAEGRARGIWF